MSNDLASAVLMTAVGAGVAAMCARSVRQTLRRGEGRARGQTFRRDEDRWHFRAVVAATAGGALVGLIAFLFGAAALLVEVGASS